MPTPIFSGKLDALPATLDLFRTYDAEDLTDALRGAAEGHALAIGSGGSAIAAEFLARCRDTLGLGPTTVQTPMQIVLEASSLATSDVWLFSAGGDNADVVAAARAAVDRAARSIHVVTRNRDGGAVRMVAEAGGHVHVVPVADPKDGYLATHSLVATAAALLVASDAASGDPLGAEALLDALGSGLTRMRDPGTRFSTIERLAGLTPSGTVVVAFDPLLRPAAVLLDTSIWEASLCHVQSADFRNLAHGRHAWLHHRTGETLILALTGVDSGRTWSAIDGVLPDGLRRLTFEHGSGGRLDNALALLDALGVVEAVGSVVGIDPGKPGIGDFGRSIYEDRSLTETASAMTSHIRHKRSKVARSDAGGHGGTPLHEVWTDRLERLAAASIGGLVFDYDGTLVTTDGRFEPPTDEILAELVRLHEAGLAIGIATGRGGSAGEDLRKVLPEEMLRSIPIGYYNGGHLRSADVDIDEDPAEADPAIAETASWLRSRPAMFEEVDFKEKEVQIMLDMKRIVRPYRFALDMKECPTVADGRVRITASGHSYDIVPASSRKSVVVDALESRLAEGLEILRFGDSGSRTGNDHELLAHPFGISVDEVCGAPDGCWGMFGPALKGVAALLKILRALVACEDGRIRLDVASLGLDS